MQRSLNNIKKCCCLLWTKAHLKQTEVKWKTVLWSDEPKFKFFLETISVTPYMLTVSGTIYSCYQRTIQQIAYLMVKGMPTQLERLHQCKIVHTGFRTDIFPQNKLWQRRQRTTKPTVGDLQQLMSSVPGYWLR